MNNNLLRAFQVLVFSVLIYACNFTPGEVGPPEWRSSFIGPIASSQISLEDLLTFDSLGVDYRAAASEIDPNLNGTSPFGIPGASIESLPADTINITEQFEYAIFDSGFINFEFVNNLPITLNPGQIIEIRSETGIDPNDPNGDVIFEYTIDEPLAPNQTVNARLSDFAGLVVSKNLILQIGNISWDTITEPVTFTGESGVDLLFTFTEIKVRQIAVSSGNSFEIGDTSEFSLGTDPGSSDVFLDSGTLNLRFSNGVPLNIEMKIDLFDAGLNLLEQNILPVGQNVIEASGESVVSIVLNQDNIDNFSNASFIASNVVLSDQATIPDGTVIINSDSLIAVKVVGELNLLLSP